MADKSKLGKEYRTVVCEVEKVKIKEMVQAIEDKNKIYVDKDVANSEGYKDTPTSPTFIQVLGQWSGVGEEIISDLNINFARVLHGEERYEYYQEIYPGDILTAKPRISAFVEKEGKAGGKMHLVTMEFLYVNQKGEPVLKQESVMVERM